MSYDRRKGVRVAAPGRRIVVSKRTDGAGNDSERGRADTARGVVRLRPERCSGGTATTRVWHGGHHTDRS